jgi:hypothetical protein
MLTIFSTCFPPTVVGVAAVSMTGCSTANLAASAQDVAVVAKQIASAIATEAPTVSADLTTAANDLSSLATALAAGTTTQDKVLAAVAAVDQILGTIPSPAAQSVSQFLPIAVAAILAIYSLFGQPAVTPTANVARAPRATTAIQPVVIKHRLLRSPDGDFKAAWNAAVAAHPTKGIAAL